MYIESLHTGISDESGLIKSPEFKKDCDIRKTWRLDFFWSQLGIFLSLV